MSPTVSRRRRIDPATATCSIPAIAASIAADPDNARLENLTLKLDQTTATGGLTIRNLADPVIDFALKADSFDADRYLAPPTEEKAAESKEGGGDFKDTPIPVEALDAVNATGTIQLGALKLKGMSFTDIRIALETFVARRLGRAGHHGPDLAAHERHALPILPPRPVDQRHLVVELGLEARVELGVAPLDHPDRLPHQPA